MRIFKKNNFNNEENNFEVLKIEKSQIEKKIDFSDSDLVFKFLLEDMENFENWTEVEGLTIDIEDLKGYCLIDNSIVENWFLQYVFNSYESIEELNEREDLEITEKEFNEQFEKVKNDYMDYEVFEQGEYFTYWDGSNHKEIMLSHGYIDSELTEITEDKEFIEVEEIDYRKANTGHYRTIKTEDGSIFEIYVSYYQGHISDTWKKIK